MRDLFGYVDYPQTFFSLIVAVVGAAGAETQVGHLSSEVRLQEGHRGGRCRCAL